MAVRKIGLRELLVPDWIQRHSTAEDRREIRRWKHWQRKKNRKPQVWKFERNNALRVFWPKFNAGDGIQKIALLIEMAGQVFGDKNGHKGSLRKRRSRFDENKGKYYRLDGPCRVCGRAANVRHHIVQLQNGGGNHGTNLVRLCDGCHATVHPWMAG